MNRPFLSADLTAALSDPEALAEILADVEAIDPDRFAQALSLAGIIPAGDEDDLSDYPIELGPDFRDPALFAAWKVDLGRDIDAATDWEG